MVAVMGRSMREVEEVHAAHQMRLQSGSLFVVVQKMLRVSSRRQHQEHDVSFQMRLGGANGKWGEASTCRS